MMAKATLVPKAVPKPLCLGRKDCAQLMGVSVQSWDRRHSAGGTPPSMEFGGRVLWRRSDIEEWIAAGCPNREEFVKLSK